MRAIEVLSRTDKSGILKLECKLHNPEKNVRILMLFEEDEKQADDEQAWLQYVSNNPAFGFLNEPEENVYSLNDGEPLE